MGSADFLKSVLARYVSVAELVVSVACSDDKNPLSIQDAARVILACCKPNLEGVTLMKLEETGLPGPDPDGTAIQTLESLAGFEEDLTLLLPRRNATCRSICDACRNHGFNDEIWGRLAASRIGTKRRVDPSTGDTIHTLLSSVRSSTPREIGFFLEPLGHRPPNTIRELRNGYSASEIAILEPPARHTSLKIDQEIDLLDAARWLEHRGVKWPIPKLLNTQCIASEPEQTPRITEPDKNTNNSGHRRIGAFAAQMTKAPEQVEDLRQQLEQERTAREAAERRAEQAEVEAKRSQLLAIAGLLELLLDDSRPRYDQGTAAKAIAALGWYGASASTLNRLFAVANGAAKDADSDAQAKAAEREVTANRRKGRKR